MAAEKAGQGDRNRPLTSGSSTGLRRVASRPSTVLRRGRTGVRRAGPPARRSQRASRCRGGRRPSRLRRPTPGARRGRGGRIRQDSQSTAPGHPSPSRTNRSSHAHTHMLDATRAAPPGKGVTDERHGVARADGCHGGSPRQTDGCRGHDLEGSCPRHPLSRSQDSCSAPNRCRASTGMSGCSRTRPDLLHGPRVAVGVGEPKEGAAVARVDDLDLAARRHRGRRARRGPEASETTSCVPFSEPGIISRLRRGGCP